MSLQKIPELVPVQLNTFEVKFNAAFLSKKEKDILSDCVKTVNYTAGDSFNTLNISFAQYVIEGVAQPIKIIERFPTSMPTGDETALTISIRLHDQFGSVIRKIKFYDCNLTDIVGLTCFDYAASAIQDLHVSIVASHLKIK